MQAKSILAAMTVFAMATTAEAGLFDWIKKAGDVVKTPDTTGQAGPASLPGALTQTEMVNGLKQALSVGADRAISQIGKPGGFASDELIRIAVPEQLQTLASGLRKVGQSGLVDQFEQSMNSAAESAVKEALPVFTDAISNMKLEDAVEILKGPDNAATEYFRKNTTVQLTERIMPLVNEAMQASNVNSYYQALLNTARSIDRFGLLGLVVPEDTADIDSYVTSETLSGAFSKLALEEQKIRANPAQRSTDLLKKVFGAMQ